MLKSSTKRAIVIILSAIVIFQVVLLIVLWHKQVQKNDNYSQQLDNLQSQLNPTGTN